MGSYIQWDQVIMKNARGKNDCDLGVVQEVTSDYVITHNEFEKKIFQLPKGIAKSFNGEMIIFDLSESDANSFYLTREGSVHENNESQLDRTMKSISDQRKMPTEENRLKINETIQSEIELTHEELVIEQKRLPKPEKINEQEINEQNSDSVIIKIPLKSQEIKLE